MITDVDGSVTFGAIHFPSLCSPAVRNRSPETKRPWSVSRPGPFAELYASHLTWGAGVLRKPSCGSTRVVHVRFKILRCVHVRLRKPGFVPGGAHVTRRRRGVNVFRRYLFAACAICSGMEEFAHNSLSDR